MSFPPGTWVGAGGPTPILTVSASGLPVACYVGAVSKQLDRFR